MGTDLMMEPYATMCQDERPESRIFDELCFPDIDKLFARLGLNWDDFFATADIDGRLPHDAAFRLLAEVEPHRPLAGKLLTLLHLYRDWYEHPDRVATQMQGISKGRAPGMEGRIGHLPEKRPYLVLI